jgi:hypothetical protein
MLFMMHNGISDICAFHLFQKTLGHKEAHLGSKDHDRSKAVVTKCT